MESVKSLVDSLGVKRLALMGATALALIVGLYFLSSRLDSADYGILFTDLPPEQAQGITESCAASAYPSNSRRTARRSWPSAKVPELRIQLAGEQITGQIGYELLDKQDPLGTSSFLQNVNHLRAIEGELVRSIETLNAVERARVHLVMPERQLFEKEAHKATASITLRTRAPLTQAQVGAIRNLVAAAVPDLSPDHVSIIDQNGTQLARPGDDAMGTASAIEEQRVAIQNRLREQIETMLERVVGPGHVRAEVSAALSQDNVREESEVYDPDRQVVDQQTTVQRTNRQNDADGTSGAVTVANQLPENQGGQQGGQTSSSAADETSEQVNYANSRTRTTTIRDAGAIAKLTVSVVVDGVSVAGPDGKLAYTPRSAAEIAKLTRLVENAIGFDSERGDSVVVENLRFVQPTELDGIVQEACRSAFRSAT
ncbi:flagellar basal-body MS-ring/collar protein FliF [Hankyongella ginsenosidimutans]|nr:flagellar basal-body MS-ring/collar protein FliF [Hankyongella ginsenosidimutans]